jgi:hypothetical protein
VKPRWEAWLRRIRIRLRGRSTQDHPSVEMLAAYHDDQLPREDDEEIQEHFVDCPECPELMLDLDRFTSPAAVEAAKGELSDRWVDMAWRRLRARLMIEAPPAQSLRWLRSPLLAWGVTALLTPCAVNLWLRVGELAEDMRGLEAPQLNPPALRVESASAVRSTAPVPQKLEVPADARQFLLVLLSTEVSSAREYRLEIRNEDGKDIWAERGLQKSIEGTFVVTLSRGFLPAGLYRFRVTGIADGGEEPLTEEFPLRLSYR